MNTSIRKKSKIKQGMAILLGISLLLGTTYAWRDLSQHKTNPWGELKNDSMRNVTLNDEFIPPTKDDPLVTIRDKKVSVSNLSDSNGFACVRLAVREFMQLRIDDNPDTVYLDDKTGEPILFATFASKVTGADGIPMEQGSYMTSAWAQANGFKTYGSFPVTIGYDPVTKLPIIVDYATTNIKELRNGIYGKPMPVVGQVLQIWNNAPFAQPRHLARGAQVMAPDGSGMIDYVNGECNYTPYDFQGLEKTKVGMPQLSAGTLTPEDNNIRSYVTLKMGDNSEVTLQTLSAWNEDDNGALVNEWLYGEDGYVYWGNRLAPGETTKNLIEKVDFSDDPGKWSNTPNGNNNNVNNEYNRPVKVDYFIHIDMDATDETEKEIISVFGNVPGADDWADLTVSAGVSVDRLHLLKLLAGVTS